MSLAGPISDLVVKPVALKNKKYTDERCATSSDTWT